jgi:hypothetical protein
LEPRAQAIYAAARANNHTKKEARRVLKRHLSDVVYRRMIHDLADHPAQPPPSCITARGAPQSRKGPTGPSAASRAAASLTAIGGRVPPISHGGLDIGVVMAGLRHPRGMKSRLREWRARCGRWRICGPRADADFSLVLVSPYRSPAWGLWPEPRTVAMSTRYSIALLCGAPAGGDRIVGSIEGSCRWTGSLIVPARLTCTRRA